MIAGNRISITARFPRCHRHGLCCHRSFFWRNGLMGLAVYIMSCVGFWEVFIAGCKPAGLRRQGSATHRLCYRPAQARL
jgi:hypothetical protein